MKNILSKILFTFSIASLFVACDDDAELTTQVEVKYPESATVTASVSTVVLTAETDLNEVITFSWPAIDFGYTDKVTYSLQFDVPASLTSATPWGSAKKVEVGEKILTKTMLGFELNKIALELGMPSTSLSSMIVRAVATVDRDVYTNYSTIEVQPYEAPIIVDYPSTIWIQGAYMNWSWGVTVPTIVSVPDDGVLEGYIYIPAGKELIYKMYEQADWGPMSYGDSTISGNLIIANYAGANFTAPSEGYYEISADFVNMKWTQTLTTWSIIGDATPGKWATDTQMSYDAVNQVWTVTADMLSTGSFKFRANNDWKIDFGVDDNGKLQYVDNPLYPYNGTLDNLVVPTSGNYTITLDLHVAGDYTYKIVKN